MSLSPDSIIIHIKKPKILSGKLLGLIKGFNKITIN